MVIPRLAYIHEKVRSYGAINSKQSSTENVYFTKILRVFDRRSETFVHYQVHDYYKRKP